MKNFKNVGLAAFLLAVAWIVPPISHRALRLCPTRPDGVDEARAVPAFSRKYGFSCMQCHTSFPTLNDFGRQFKLDGYVVAKGSEAGVMKSVDEGLWTETAFPLSSMIRSRPVDYVTGVGQKQVNTTAISDVDFFFAGGDAAKRVSWFGELDLNSNAGFAPMIGDAQVGYHPSQYLNLIATRRPIWAALDPYQTLGTAAMGTGGLAPRAVDGMLPDQGGLSGDALSATKQAVGLYGYVDCKAGRLFYSGGETSDYNNSNRGGGYKAGNVRLAYEPRNGLMLGTFASYGADGPIGLFGNTTGPADGVDFLRAGVDTLIEKLGFVGRAVFLYAHDTDNTAQIKGTDRAAYAEVLYPWTRSGEIAPFLVPLVRYNWYTTNNGVTTFHYTTVQLAHYFQSNVKGFIEYTDANIEAPVASPNIAASSPKPSGGTISAQVELGF